MGREEETVVLEVLYDRFGGREGRWVALRADVRNLDQFIVCSGSTKTDLDGSQLDGVELRSAF